MQCSLVLVQILQGQGMTQPDQLDIWQVYKTLMSLVLAGPCILETTSDTKKMFSLSDHAVVPVTSEAHSKHF